MSDYGDTPMPIRDAPVFDATAGRFEGVTTAHVNGQGVFPDTSEQRDIVTTENDLRTSQHGLLTEVVKHIRGLLCFIGEDPLRGGLDETPTRVAKAWMHWCGGYQVDVAKLLKTFEDGAENYDEMVIVKDIPFYSHCEHHMAPFFGTATIAYVPDKRIVGLSKLARVTDAFARRLQVQERMTSQIADALAEHLKPLGVGVVIKARHMCMESRGVAKQGHYTVTSALRGAFKDQPEARSEFLKLAQ